MAFDNPPFVIDATTVDGEVIRRAIGSIINSAGGVVTPGDLTVTQNGTPNMTVNIGIGQIWVPGSSTSTQGPYYSRNAGSISQAINAASATLPRIDTVGVQVQDKAYAGTLTQIASFYVAGTATAGANLTNLTGKGTVPASSYVLGYVVVPANATSIVTADILNVASLASLGVAPQNFRIAPGSITANPGDFINASSGQTITLPTVTAATPFLPITVFNGSGSGQVTITSGSTIAGVGLSATSFVQGPLAPVKFMPNAGSNWLIVDGQQDTGWVLLTLNSGITTPSGQAPAAARLQGDRVELSGTMTCASTQTNAFWATVPAAARPTVSGSAATLQLPVIAGSNTPQSMFVSGSSGAVTVLATVTATGTVNLDGVSYAVTR